MMLLPALVIAVLLGPVGCPAPRGTAISTPVTTAQASPLLDDEVARLEALLAAGRAQDVLDGLPELEATWRDAPDAATLQVLRGRAQLALGDRVGAAATFQSVGLPGGPALDPALRGTARLYGALLIADDGRIDDAIASLELEDVPGPLVGEDEAARLWVLVAERRTQAADRVGALAAMSLAFETSRERDALAALNAFAVSQAYALAAELSPEERELSWLELPALARAAVGFEIVRDRRAAGDQLGAETGLLETSAALVACDQLDRLAELEHVALANDGSKRLVGAILPMTGESRRVGRTVLAGILQGQGAFFPGGGQRLTIVFKDSGSDPQQAAEAVRELHALGALAVLGPLGIDETLAAAAVADELGLPLISLAPDPTALSQHSLRFGLDLGSETVLIAQTAGALGLRRALVVRPETPYGRESALTFATELAATGGDVVGELTYEPGSPDLRKLAEAAAKLDMDAVFVPDTGEGAALVASFLAQKNIWSHAPGHVPGSKEKRRFVVYLGTGAWYGLEPERAARYLEGALFAASYAREHATPANTQFVETFERLYGRQPGAYEAIAYDATRWIRDLVMGRGLNDRAGLRAALQSGEVRSGATGKFALADRNAAPAPILLQMSATGVAVVDPAAAPASEVTPAGAPAPEGEAPPDDETPPDIGAILATPPGTVEP